MPAGTVGGRIALIRCPRLRSPAATATACSGAPSTTAKIGDRSSPGGSTWQSLARGATELETDYLNGEIVLLGRLHGIPTPANELLQQLARGLAATRQRPGAVPATVILEQLGQADG